VVTTWFDFKDALSASSDLRIKRDDAEQNVHLEMRASDALLADAHLRPDPKGFYSGITSLDVRVAKVDAGSPAAKMGLQPGDRLVALEGKPISAWRFDLAQFDGSDARKEFTVTYARGTEIKEGKFNIDQREEIDDLKQKQKTYVFGAENDPRTLHSASLTRTYSFAGAVAAGIDKTWTVSSLTLRGLGLMLTGRISMQNVGGPVMMFVVAEKAVQRGWATFFSIMALISINLGIMNLLPVPVLDGGHLVFFAAEGLSRRPIPLRVREYAQVFGLVLLLLLMALALFNDSRFFIG
jgi:regulator of sigma E protease